MCRRFSLLICIFTVYYLGSRFACAAACKSLDGQWHDPASTRNAQLIFRFSPLPATGLTVFAVTGNQQWATGQVDIDFTTGHLVVLLDNGNKQVGNLDVSTCSLIKWSVPAGPVWKRIPQIDRVHVVFMNHLDVGYNGIPATGFVNNVLNVYFQDYFPRAVRLAEEMARYDPSAGFIYTTHPWLIDLYLNCPPNLVLSGIKLQCPSQEAVEEFSMAVKLGYIAWHAGPMNMQVELMNSALLQAGLDISSRLDKQFGQKTTVFSQRDVPGMTSCVIPHLLDNGINAVSVGVNPGSAPPAVPNLFQWEYDSKQIVALWHPGGYPLNPGNSLTNAGGLSLLDCVINEESAQALAFAFRTDNSGPPTSTSEIDSYYSILREQFLNATVVASTLTKFVNSIEGVSLPIVKGEIGDTWIQGVASDPRKMAELRAAMSGLEMCMQNLECELSHSQVRNATRFLVKLPEHTWGLPDVGDNVNWSNAAFTKAQNLPNYVNCAQSWLEQRNFLDITLQASEGHPLYNYIFKALQELVPSPPSLAEYSSVNPRQTFKILNEQVAIAFDPASGWITTLTLKEFSFADTHHPLAVLTYHTYNETDFQYMNSLYDYYGNAGYDKPNSTMNAHPNTSVADTKLMKLYQSNQRPSDFILLMQFSDTLHTYYGAPQIVWLKISITIAANPSACLNVSLEITWINKTATRLAESTMLSFFPLLQSQTSVWKGWVRKISDSTAIDITSVVTNGSQYQHAAQSVMFQETVLAGSPVLNGTVAIYWSPDIPLICPIVSDYNTPTPFPAPLNSITASKLHGVAFNLHNNIWNTNYPLWYPFTDDDSDVDFKARFSVSFKV